jgi:hypothetical protein
MVSVPREWPAPGRKRLRVLGRLQTPVLCVAAALFGAALSAAVLIGYWGDQVQGKRTAQVKLADSRAEVKALTAQNARLRVGLGNSRAASARLERSLARIRVETKALTAQNAALVASAGTLHGRGGSLQQRALALSRLAATLGHDVSSAVNYIRTTPLGSLDPAYLKAQLDYLEPAVASIRSAADALGSESGSYASAVDGFAAQAEAYAGAVRRLARASAP